MNNFYELFEVVNSASPKEILMGYENKITKYNNLTFLTDKQIYDIKMLKIGLYILLDPNLRSKYNKIMGITNKKLKKNKSKTEQYTQDEQHEKNQEPIAVNELQESTLDTLFNVDNSWMKNINTNINNDSGRKMRNETNIGDRIFSLSELNQRPGYSSDFEASLRKPQQGREEKSDNIVNKNIM
jgi:hypothetical protein